MGIGINGGVGVALSGMRAAATRLRTSAHNVANVQTPDFKAQKVVASDLAGGGVEARVVQPMEGASGTDLAGEMVSLSIAQGTYTANLRVLETLNEVRGTILDLKA